MTRFISIWLAALTVLLSGLDPTPASASEFALGFTNHTTRADGRVFFYRVGGSGPVVVLLHGYADTGDMWASLVPMLARHYRVIVPGLPGLGRSRPEAWNAHYDVASVARSLHAFLVQLHVRREAIVAHDIGLMVAYAYAAQYRTQVTKLALIDAPIPGVGPWQQVLLVPATWHFHFYGKYAEELVAGRERIYLDRIWDDFAAHPERITEARRERYAASYAQPGNMHAGFEYFKNFDVDADENREFAKIPLTMPVLAMGGAKSFSKLMPEFVRAVATNVTTSVIPDSGHWVMDENPHATEAALSHFLSN